MTCLRKMELLEDCVKRGDLLVSYSNSLHREQLTKLLISKNSFYLRSLDFSYQRAVTGKVITMRFDTGKFRILYNLLHQEKSWLS